MRWQSSLNKLRRQSSESGAALAMVLIMVIVLGLWMGAVATLAQNSNTIIRTNVEQSAMRTQMVSYALTQSLNQLEAV